MQAAIVSTYFDYDDYDTPIKTYIEDQDYASLSQQFSNSLEVKVQKNTVSLYDNLFYNFGPKKLTFYNSSKRIFRIDNLATTQNTIFYTYVTLDRTSQEYERVVYTFLDLFGFLGGLFDFMFFFGLLCIRFFTASMYLKDVFSKLYQIRIQQENVQLQQTELNTVSKKFLRQNKKFEEDLQKHSSSNEMHSDINISKPHDNDSKEINNMKSFDKNEVIENTFSKF